MTASLKIDQVGLSAGVAGKARQDGLSDGSTVTLTSVSPGTTNTFRLLYWPPEDDEADDSLTPTGGGATPVWTFAPKVGVDGPYLIELIVDEGLPSEARQRRLFGIPSWRHGLVAPALNERGDPLARSGLTGGELATALGRVDRNVSPSGGASVDGWQRSLIDMTRAIERGNYSQIVVPNGATCVVPAGQLMLYSGGLHGDFNGDFKDVGLPRITDGQVYGIPTTGVSGEGGGTTYLQSGLRGLGPAALRHILGAFGKSSSFDIATDSAGPQLAPATTFHNYGLNSAAWRRNYAFEFLTSDPGTPAIITGFAHDERDVHVNGPEFAYTRFIRLNQNSTCGLVLKHDDAGSEVANRILTPNGLDYYIGPGQTCLLVYAGSRFWVIGDLRSQPWSDTVITTADTHTMQPGGVVNRYDSQYNDGIVLALDHNGMLDGTEVVIKEVGGVGGYEVVVSAAGTGVESPRGPIESSFTLLPSDRSASMTFKWDLEYGYWRLIHFRVQEPGD